MRKKFLNNCRSIILSLWNTVVAFLLLYSYSFLLLKRRSSSSSSNYRERSRSIRPRVLAYTECPVGRSDCLSIKSLLLDSKIIRREFQINYTHTLLQCTYGNHSKPLHLHQIQTAYYIDSAMMVHKFQAFPPVQSPNVRVRECRECANDDDGRPRCIVWAPQRPPNFGTIHSVLCRSNKKLVYCPMQRQLRCGLCAHTITVIPTR